MKVKLMRVVVAAAAAIFHAALFFSLAHTHAQAAPRLRVAPNNRFLVKQDGSPFFYLGDTAWELFHRLSREEADEYLRDRAAKGFTVIQAVVLAELDGLTAPNAYGDLPLENNDPARPVEAYFRHVDFVIKRAGELGMYVGVLPTWGDKWNRKWGTGPEIFTPENARKFGEFLGRRYRASNVIWILGGDRNPENETHLGIVRALARGLRRGDGGSHLMTYHPQGWSSSSAFFHGDDWLDFNMFQSGHGARDAANYQFTTRDRELTPPKPTLDGEARYEDHPVDWKPEKGWFDDADVRQAAYWSMLAGACGHTYGNHDIWQFWQEGRAPISAARTPWRTALAHTGSAQMGYLRRLFESRPFTELAPDQELIASGQGEGANHVRAARAEDGSFAFVYTPMGSPVTVALSKLKGEKLAAHWYDPRRGVSTKIGLFRRGAPREFIPPTKGRGNDWILVLDDAARRFAPPGARLSRARRLRA